MKLPTLQLLTFLGATGLASAIPTLQLDIVGGVYDSSTETIVSSSDQFSLLALINGSLAGEYYLSAAITPKLVESTPSPTIGSFSIDGFVIDTSMMEFGNPPAAATNTTNELGPHGIFDTYFYEMMFTPNALNTVAAYNSETGDAAPGTLTFQSFMVDTSGLLAGYEVHFDLYQVQLVQNGQRTVRKVTNIAPYSHDAESGDGGGDGGDGGNNVPDGGTTAILFGLGLLGLGSTKRLLARK